ncbi:MAG: pyridoxal 5'-phosphate synthase glutaminase subunit PdxT [Cuniculiplasma sp.]
MKIGVIGFQGDVEEHINILKKLGEKYNNIEPVRIRNKEHLSEVSAIIIPGGESTTIYKLILEYGIYDDIIERVHNGTPLMGTCAGLIIASSSTNDPRVVGMGLLGVDIQRNAYGRQGDSFMDEVEIDEVGKFLAVFIRAPVIKSVNHGKVMASYSGKAIMVRDKNVLGLTFHPELTEDTKIHEYFIKMIGGEGGVSTGIHEGSVRVK